MSRKGYAGTFEQLMLLSKIRGRKINAALKDFLLTEKPGKRYSVSMVSVQVFFS